MKPEEGGKFQYSITMLDALTVLFDKGFIDVVAVYEDDIWKEYLTIPSIKSSPNFSFIERKSKALILKRFKMLRLWRFIGKYLDATQQLFYRQKPDLIFYPGNDNLAYECSIPSMIPIFDLMHRYEPHFAEVGEEYIFTKREHHYKNICQYAKFILVDSNLGKEQVLESYKCDAEKIVVLPYIPPRYVYESVDVHILDKYNLPDPFILYPSQFWSHKNHIAIINALCILRDKYAETIHAVFVGSTKNAYNNIQQNIVEYRLTNQIKILGYVPNNELVALYKRAEALVFPSYFGPTNIPPLEAAALGCPVILSDVYANRERLGDNAWYFDPNDHTRLAELLIKLLRGEYDAKDHNSHTDYWNKESQRDRTVKILETIIDASN